MYLYLVQHAEALAEEKDPKRPLSEKGKADIQKVAEFVSKYANISIKSIIHSGKLRAEQTAEILAKYLNPPEGIRKEEGLNPLDDPLIWANRLKEIEEDTMLVGHLPHLVKLSSYLLCQDMDKKIIEFQMGGVVCLRRDESNIWTVNWMIIPELIK